MEISPKDKQIQTIQDHLAALAVARRDILSRPAEEATERVINAPQPAALVHSFPEQDLYLLIQDIGPEDALPLLALASDRQREFIFDMESWEKDRLSPPATARWLKLLLAADPSRLISWLADHKTLFFEFLLFNSVEVRIREHDQDPSEFGPGFLTYDDVYYVRVVGDPSSSGEGKGDEDPRRKAQQELISELLQRLALWDHPKYQAILVEAMSVIPAETEEEEYRLRNVRLAEKGFLPFDEAVGIYQPLDPVRFEGRSSKGLQTGTGRRPDFPVPGHSAWVDKNTLFAGALERIEPGHVFDQLQAEFAALCNQTIVADQLLVRDKEALREVVKKVCGYLSIGLSTATEGTPDPAKAALLIRQSPLTDIFRVGFGRSLGLKWRAEGWLKEAWFRKAGLPLTFWDENWTGVLGGLLIKRPRCFDPLGKETLYREFSTPEEVEGAGLVLDDIMAVDALLGRINPAVETAGHQGMVTYKNLLLTLWARDTLGVTRHVDEAPVAEPIPLAGFRAFFQTLFPGSPPGGASRQVPKPMKAAFVKWLEAATGLAYDRFDGKLGTILENLFAAVEEDLGRVALEDLDPRFIPLFILSG